MSRTITAGSIVTIRKGVQIRSTHPKWTWKEAKLTYQVSVHHVLPPVRIPVGHRDFDTDGVVSYESYTSLYRADAPKVRRRYGTDDIEQLKEHLTEFKRFTRDNGTSYTTLMLEIEPTKVVWAGEGGYWCEVALDEIPEAQV